ncbi:cyclic lactone autoinducer peptide [Chengkuizengella marina]|nr:cyclic lactone autoinducer peptide [Chengkuizengella marina]
MLKKIAVISSLILGFIAEMTVSTASNMMLHQPKVPKELLDKEVDHHR